MSNPEETAAEICAKVESGEWELPTYAQVVERASMWGRREGDWAGIGSTGLRTAFGVTGSISCISAWETFIRGGETASCSRVRSRSASESRATDGASSLRDRGQLESIERRTCAGHRVKVSVKWRLRAHPSSKLVVRGDLLTSTTATGD